MQNRQYIALFGLLTTIAFAALCVVRLAGAESDPPFIAGGQFEASGVVHVPGTQGVLFVDDSQRQQIFWMEMGPDGSQVGGVTPVALGADVMDPEGITANATHVYVVGSQSKATGSEGDGLVRFRFDRTTRRAMAVDRITGLKGWLAGKVAELRGFEGRSGDDALNIEGLAWDPIGQRLLLGLRSPIVDKQALVIPLKMVDPAAPFTVGNLRVDGDKAIRLSLGGAGIRSLEYDTVTKMFQVISGDEGSRDWRLLEWNGQSTGTVREVATFAKHLKPEGVTRANLRGRPVRVIVFDTSRMSILN